MPATSTKKKKTRMGLPSPGKDYARYLLPADLIRRIRVEAAERGVWPNIVVEELLTKSLRDNSTDSPRAA